ncbi:hypothetical protein Pyn_39776 [Prunus yedoensis var. nudiflora]|uniref:Uncharacterized protein n=1 Tax=Prunus yedoensis var. nudiflora TaxID=2094558 RepID=A0A314XI39_PRUYE|nr:hypothetical protein Pyn_39776 [Prunus yedoensis var. nudiflora]
MRVGDNLPITKIPKAITLVALIFFWFSMVFFMLILQVFYGNMVQWDDGGDFSCASFVCLDEEGLD